MDKFYFAAKIRQEFVDTIYEKAISLGIPKISKEACKLLQLAIYIKFNDVDTYNNFNSLDIPGILERW